MSTTASLTEKPEIMNAVPEAKKDNDNDRMSNRTKSNESNANASGGAQKSLLEGNGYTVIRKIGTGSYSKVKLAYSTNHKAMVAIKVVSKYHVPEEFLRNFLYNEIKVVKFLKHENIIKYYQSIETSHRLYIIMQNAENGSILDLIHKHKRISEDLACNFFRQIMAGIEYCHLQGVAHRDIKCENILLDENFIIKIIDFGFAKCLRQVPKTKGEEKLEASLSRKSSKVVQKENPNLSETYCGSYAYASPEILLGTPYDPYISDIWAMGCVLFTMVCGRLPFDDRNIKKLIKQVHSPITFPPSMKLSDEFKICCNKIFVKSKSRASIEELKQDNWVTKEHKRASIIRT